EPYSWSLEFGSDPLPDGLTLHANGVIDGTPTTLGTFHFIVQVTDASTPLPQTATQPLSITIHAYAGSDYVISGSVTPALAGVVMSGFPGNPVTNSLGEYTAYVYSGWSGSVTPILAGYAFDPASRTYNNVSDDMPGENYTASTGYVISGLVTLDGSPLEGVLMSGLPGDPYTDADGLYYGAVPSGWTGTVTPTLPGFDFTPEFTNYSTPVTSNQLNQDYTASYVGGQDDMYENNDNFDSAAEVPLGTHTNLVLRDEDWFKVYVSAADVGKDLKVHIKGTSYPDPDIRRDLDFAVLNSDGKLLSYNICGSDDEFIYITEVTEGWYYIGQDYFGQIGTVYSLTVEVSDNFGIGYISGRVTDEKTGQGIEGAYVELNAEYFDWNVSHPLITTDANGYYKIGYIPGNYTVRFNQQNWLHRDPWAPDVNYIGETYNTGEIVPIVAGTTVSDINAELIPGGTVTGRVTDPDGNGIWMAGVYIYASDTSIVSRAYSDANGYYSAERMRTGNYKVRFYGFSYASVWFEDTGSFDKGHPVSVQEGATTPNIDAQLIESGTIEGRVTDSNGSPIQDIYVTAYDVSGIFLTQVRTDGNGEYHINSRLPAGDVVIFFDTQYVQGDYVSEYYTDKYLLEEADPITVQSGQTTYGVDAVLVEGGTISGRVTDGQGNGVQNVVVNCVDTASDRYHYATPDEDGNYAISTLPPGDYKVRFRPYSSDDFALEWYNDQNSFANGGVVSVTSGQTTQGINAQLESGAGSITGRATNSSGVGIEGVVVQSIDSTKEVMFAGSAWTDSEGFYTINHMTDGDVKIYFNADYHPLYYVPYVSEYYNDKNAYVNADPVPTALGQTTSGINAVLAPIPPVNITTTSLPNGEVAVPYEVALEATGGREFYHWSLISGSLPPGLGFNSRGEILGTPAASGTHNFTVRVTDSSRNQFVDTQTLSITIDAYTGAGYLISGAVTSGGSPMGGVVLQGLPGNPMTSPSGDYIAVVPLDWSGTVTPTHSGYFFDPANREYTNVDSNLSEQDYIAYERTLDITTEWLLNGVEGYPYNQSLSAEGGTEPYTWSLAPGSSPLPFGLTLASDGTISGTPTHSNNYDFTVRVTDSSAPISQYTERELTLNVYGDPVSDYPILYWKLDEDLGTTVAFDSSGHNVRGVLQGSADFTIDSFDGHAVEINTNGWIERETHWVSFNFVNQATIMARVKINDYNQENRFVWKLQYDEPHRGHPYSLEISMDINGSTLHLDSGNGLIQDIFNCPHYQIDVDLTSTGFTLGQYNQIAVTINGDVYKVFINGTEVASAAGAPFAVNDSVQNFWVGGADWSDYWLGGKVDEVLVFNKAYEPQDIQEIYNMGALPTISGTVRLSDGSPLAWVWMDNLGDVQTQENGEYIGVVAPGFSDTVTPEMGGYYFDPPSRTYNNVTSIITGEDYTAYEQGSLWIETDWLPDGARNQAYNTTLVAADGVPSYTWNIVSGSLPDGLTLNPSGEITGTPTEAGDFSFTVRVLDSHSPPWAAEQYLTLFISAAHQGFWTTTYPSGGGIYREGMAYDQQNSNRIFVTANMRGIFKSEDAGANWTNLIDDPDWPFGESDYPIFWTHAGLGDYYMSTWGHLYMSLEGWGDWQQIYSRDNWDIISFAVDPFGRDVIFVGTYEEGIFKTTDGGQNWAASSTGLPSDEIRVIAIDKNDLDTVYAGTSGYGLFKSIDRGDSWVSANNYIDFFTISDILILYDSTIYVAGMSYSYAQGIFRSIDNGDTWEKLPVNVSVDWSAGNYIAVEETGPNDPDIIYFASDQSVFKSADGGDNWTEYSVSSVRITSLILDRHHPHILYAGTGGEGVFKSEDSGVTWNLVNNGINALSLPGWCPYSLEIDEFNPNYIYAGSIGGGYRSLDGGGTWAKMDFPQGSSMQAIKTHQDAAGTVYVGDSRFWKRTFDIVNGDWLDPEWVDPNNGDFCCFSRLELGIAHDNPDIIYLGAGHGWGPEAGVYRSDDGGASWTLKNNGLTDTNILTLTVHPIDHQIVFAGTHMDWQSDPEKNSGLYKTTDGGETWTYISSGLPEMWVNQVVIYPRDPDPDIMYLVGAGDEICGVFKSVDGGDSWWHASDYCGNSIAVSPDDPNLVYLGSWEGFYVSLNGGYSWLNFSDGLLRNPQVNSIHLDPSNPLHVFIGTAAGVYEATFAFDFMITTEYLPTGVVGEPYSTFIEVAGGTPDYSWEMISGELPEGLTFNETTGEISGMPVEPDYRDITIKATDNGGNSYTKRFDLYVSNKYFLNVDTNPPGVGSVTVDPDEPWYIHGARVDVSVTVPGGYIFTGWSGDATGKATLVHVEMTRDKTLTANFAFPGSLPDYDFSSFEAPSSASAGDTIGGSVNADVRNQGAPDAYTGDISVGIYLSPNPEITTSDMLLWKGRLSIAPLSGGTATVPIPADLQIPTTVAAGTYSIGILVDEFDMIAEQNEDNNFASLEITISSSAYDRLELLGMWHGGSSDGVACDEARNLALVGHSAVLHVLDVSDPSHPTKIGEVTLGTREIVDIEISGDFAYIAGDGLRIVNIANQTQPMEVGFNTSPKLARGVVVSGDYAYVTDHFDQGLRVFNISNPENPTEVPNSFVSFPGRTRGIARSGNTLYLQAGVWFGNGETGIRVLDITDPESPSQVDFYTTQYGTGWPEVSGNYLLLPTNSEGLIVLDITSPQAPVYAGGYENLGNSGLVKVVGNHAYATDNNRNAVVILNISDVGNIFEEGVYHFEDQNSVNSMDVLGSHCYANGWYHSLKILNMTDPQNPYELGSYDVYEGLLRDVDVSDGYAYMVSQKSNDTSKMRTIDISNPAEMNIVGTSFDPSSRMIQVRVSGNFAYVLTNEPKLKVLDISDPMNPVEVGVFDGLENVRDLEVSGHYIFIPDRWEGLKIIDVSTPSDPTHVSTWYTPSRAFYVAIAGNYAYVGTNWRGVRIIDISDPMNPWEVGAYEAEEFYAFDLDVYGNYAYVADGEDNLQIIDVSDPQNPVAISTFITNTYIYDIEVSGHVVFIGTIIDGVMVIDVSDPFNPVKLDDYPTFIVHKIVCRDGRIYALDRGSGLQVYEYRRQ
ncbi:MAG: carboxypeptidase regulatory-like domain-containing protein, partial [Candidatus Aminicenantes bacterium]